MRVQMKTEEGDIVMRSCVYDSESQLFSRINEYALIANVHHLRSRCLVNVAFSTRSSCAIAEHHVLPAFVADVDRRTMPVHILPVRRQDFPHHHPTGIMPRQKSRCPSLHILRSSHEHDP